MHFNYLFKSDFTIKFLFFLMLINSLSNFSNSFLIDRGLDFYKLVSLIFCIFFYFNLAKVISKILKISSLSLSIVYFFSSYFLINLFLITVLKNFSFQLFFIYFSILWVVFILLKKPPIFDSLSLVFSYILMRVYNFEFYSKLVNKDNFIELNNDVIYQWYPGVQKIYNVNLTYAFTNNIVVSQSLFPSYIQALIQKINFFTDQFEFLQINSLLFLFFSLLVFHDLKINTDIKILLSITYLLFILNNIWVFYLLANSLMIEGIVNFLFSAVIVNLTIENKYNTNKNLFYFLVLGSIVLTKQFISVLTLVYLLINIFKNKKYIYSLIPLSFELLYKSYYDLRVSIIPYTDNLTLIKTLENIILKLKNPEFINLNLIMNEIKIDKPFSVLLIFFILKNLFNIFQKNKIKIINNYFFIFPLINFIFVLVLYLTYWNNIETASSYRYLIIFTNLYLISLSSNSLVFEDKN